MRRFKIAKRRCFYLSSCAKTSFLSAKTANKFGIAISPFSISATPHASPIFAVKAMRNGADLR